MDYQENYKFLYNVRQQMVCPQEMLANFIVTISFNLFLGFKVLIIFSKLLNLKPVNLQLESYEQYVIKISLNIIGFFFLFYKLSITLSFYK